MSWSTRILSWVRGVAWSRNFESDMRTEMQFHMESYAEDLIRRGISPEEARRRARLEFGTVETTKDACRSAVGIRLWDELWADARYTLRLLRRNPGFTAVAVLTLALGIGVNTSMFAIINAVLLRPLPFAQPDRLHMVSYMPADFPFPIPPSLIDADYVQFRGQDNLFEQIAAFHGRQLTLTGAGEPVRLSSTEVTVDFLPLLRSAPAIGRGFLAEDVRPQHQEVAIVSNELWRSRFNSDPAIVGKTIELESISHTVIGVMPPGMDFPYKAQVWTPFVVEAKPNTAMFVQTVGRLKPHVSERELAAELETIATHFGAFGGQSRKEWRPRVLPLKDLLVGNVRKLLIVFGIAVGFVLLIACSNVANLLLARATRREVEIAVRSALGAGRGRLLRQMLVESLLMALAGALGGIAFSWWGISTLLALAPEGKIPREQLIHIDARVLGFTLLVSIGASLLFGLAPALQATRRELRETLSHAGTNIAGHRQWLRNSLVVGEVAMALVLLAGTGLLLRTFLRLRAVDPGFHADNDLVMTINLPQRVYRTGQQMLAFHEQVLSRLVALRGVETAAAVNSRPLGGVFVAGDFKLEDGRKLPEGYIVDKLCVSPGYFRTLGIPLIRGRDFTASDNGGTQPVAIISESVAQRLWPNEDPIGKRITGLEHPKESDWRTIVGVVGDVHQKGLTKPVDPATYEAIAQSEQDSWLIHMNFVVRAANNPESLVPPMRSAVNETDKNQPVESLATMQTLVSETLADQVFETRVLSAFALLALLLALVGIYGVFAYTVAQRTREIGIRMAMGAQRMNVVGMVLRQVALLAAAGVALGTAGALALTRSLASFLFEVKPGDPLTFATVALTLLCAAMLAAAIPAGRAARIDPMLALRYE